MKKDQSSNTSSSLKNVYYVSPYMCIMISIGLIGITAVTITLSTAYAKQFIPKDIPINLLWKNEAFQIIVFFIGLLILIYIGTIKEAFQLYGKMIIQDDRLVFKALFRRSRTLYFNEIKHIGIGSAPNGLKWIYFSKVPIPPKELRNFYRVNMSKQTMYLPYREEVAKSLKHYLPKELSRAL